MPDGTTAYDDVVHGRIEFDNAVIEDFVVLRSDRYPTYHLSVVVDDIDMGITDVVRGDDHISNTPKQVLLYEALGAPVPRFAHVPLILGPDKRRLSKRHGATSVMEYERQGFLPEAMFNFLALLGWSPGAGDREVFTREELVEAFSLDGISSSNAVFNPEKLEWFNSQHIARLGGDEITRRLEPALREAGVWSDGLRGERREWFHQVIEILKPRAKKLRDIVEQGRYFFVDPAEYDEAAVKKHLSAPGLAGHVKAWADALAAVGAVLRGGDRGGAARVRRVAGHQGGGADPRDARRGDGAGRQPQPLRRRGACRPRGDRAPPGEAAAVPGVASRPLARRSRSGEGG